jgi:hypothetical protein
VRDWNHGILAQLLAWAPEGARAGLTSGAGAGIIARSLGWGWFFSIVLEFTMYAVIKTGGKQYRVAPGEKIKVEQIPADIGSEIVLDQVLMVADGDAVSIGDIAAK